MDKKESGTSKTISVRVQKRQDPTITQSFLNDKKKGFTYFQDMQISILESTMIHLKENYQADPLTQESYKKLKRRACIHLCLFFIDWLLSASFQICHILYFLIADFDEESNHILHVLIGAGFTNIILFYCFSDGVRFLRSNIDKFLYLISCALQKPLLLPLLFPSRFRSRIASKHLDSHTVNLPNLQIIEGRNIQLNKVVQPTNFLLAVQETNFLYSFTLSGFVAVTTSCTLLIADNFDDEKYGLHSIIMLAISATYAIFGTCISIYLYGRKTLHLFDSPQKDEEEKKEVDEEEKKEVVQIQSNAVNESEETTETQTQSED